MSLFEKCRQFTEARQAQAAGYYPYFIPIQDADATAVVIDGKQKVMIGSNNYLGLTHHPKVIEAAEQALKKYGSGCTGSRYLNGTLALHEELEAKLADFLHMEAALVFSTGFQTNLGIISALVGDGDAVFIDRLDHASIVDGCRLSYGETIRFRHNDIDDLERAVVEVGPEKGKLIAVDGIYSMDGDIADIPGILSIAQEYGCQLMIDDAHSIGVLGENGRGTAEHFGVEDQVDLIMITFSKSLASIGGMVAGDEDVIHYIKHYARSMIFSASAPPSSVATVIAALEVIQEEPERQENLWRNTRKMKREFNRLGFDTGKSETPVIPIIVRDVMKTAFLWRRLFDEGVFTNVAISPAVPVGSERLRTSYMATHTDEQLDFVLDRFEKIGKELRII
ncbi:MAG: aminotransferase class I/II-fold pyridoxal phosphate-dependent enzyme [Candidatus Bipolaricaulia bacterium]